MPRDVASGSTGCASRWQRHRPTVTMSQNCGSGRTIRGPDGPARARPVGPPLPHCGQEAGRGTASGRGEQRAFHDTITTLALVVPVSSTDRGWENHVALRGEHGLACASYAMTEQVRAISRERFAGRAGMVDAATLSEIRQWIVDYLA